MDQPPTSPELDVLAISARIRAMLTELRIDATHFSARVGVSYSAMRTYMNGRAPSAEFLAGCAGEFGISPLWLLLGTGPMKHGQRDETSATLDEFAVIPVLSVRASAGNGLVVNDQVGEYRVGGLSFSRSWIAKRHLSIANLRVITVQGASMEEVLSDGDQVLVDQSDTQPRTGFVYVLLQGSELLVKYCQMLPGGVLRVSSANPSYPSYDVDLSKVTDVKVVGRVVASMHEW